MNIDLWFDAPLHNHSLTSITWKNQNVSNFAAIVIWIFWRNSINKLYGSSVHRVHSRCPVPSCSKSNRDIYLPFLTEHFLCFIFLAQIWYHHISLEATFIYTWHFSSWYLGSYIFVFRMVSTTYSLGVYIQVPTHAERSLNLKMFIGQSPSLQDLRVTS